MSVPYSITIFTSFLLGRPRIPNLDFFLNLIIRISQNCDTYFYAFLNSPARVTCPAYLIQLDLLTQFYTVKEESCLVHYSVRV
jgi:hypothetical protein